MNKPSRLAWSSAACSHVGAVRKINEDACLDLPAQGLWAVADGMGGHEAGDVASRMIVDGLQELPPPVRWEDHVAATQRQLRLVNRRLREKSAESYRNRTIGSTVAVLLAYRDQGACLWVGDSRIYRLRRGRLTQLTRDHSHVQELIDRGVLDADQALRHPMANVITRAVGSAEALDLDVLRFPLQAGDAFVLCSDGLTKVVADDEIAELVSRHGSQEAVAALIDLALVRAASDNVTVVVVKIGGNPPDPSESTAEWSR